MVNEMNRFQAAISLQADSSERAGLTAQIDLGEYSVSLSKVQLRA